jgi:hypothetical protein
MTGIVQADARRHMQYIRLGGPPGASQRLVCKLPNEFQVPERGGRLRVAPRTANVRKAEGIAELHN